MTHEVVTITNTTYIHSESVVALLQQLETQFTDHPITVVLDNARYQRNPYVMAEAERLQITLMGLPTYSPNLNLIERLWKLVTADELCSEYWWCLHGRYYPTFAPFKQAIIDCLVDTSPSYKKKLASLVSIKIQLFNKAS